MNKNIRIETVVLIFRVYHYIKLRGKVALPLKIYKEDL